jgi:aerobic carbon-monoxide dehydrogenase medium subunit
VKPPAFEYAAPTELEEALALLAEHGGDARVLAGGQSLVPALNLRLLRPTYLVDVNRIAELDYLRSDGDMLRIGALTRQATLERSELAAGRASLLPLVLPHVGHMHTRSRGTIGGSVAHADPAAELPTALATLDARFHARSRRGRRTLTADEFFVAENTTALSADELLVEIELPALDDGARCGFAELARTHGDFATAGAAVVVEPARAAIGLLGVGETPFRAPEAEQALVQGASAREAGALAAESVEGDYRRALVRELVRRAVDGAA